MLLPSQLIRFKCSLNFLTLFFAACSVARTQEFSEADKSAFVVIHNRLREAAFPRAENMRFVIWDAKLERLAIDAANKCINDHNYDGEYKGLGENIYQGGRTNPNEITLAWYSEKSMYNPELTSCKGCGHYTQVMTAAVTKIGCGIKRDCQPNVNLVFCEYDAGNGYYTRGPSCSACPSFMPLCLNGLCVSQDLAGNPVTKMVDSTVSTAADFKCRLVCRNCGILISDPSSTQGCRCNCGPASATGGVCENKLDSSTAKCSPCTGLQSPPCLNNGKEDVSDPLKCKCGCTPEFVGERCEIPRGQLDNSALLQLSAANEFKFAKFVILPPVSRSQFNSQVWTVLQVELVKAVNSFCVSNADNFAKCCPGKPFPANPSSLEHVKAADFMTMESSFGNTFTGALNLIVYATVSTTSQLCPSSGSAASPNYVPQSALLPAILSAQTDISKQLDGCCGKLVLKEVKAGELGASAGPSTTARNMGEIAPRLCKYLLLQLALPIIIWY